MSYLSRGEQARLEEHIWLAMQTIFYPRDPYGDRCPKPAKRELLIRAARAAIAVFEDGEGYQFNEDGYR